MHLYNNSFCLLSSSPIIPTSSCIHDHHSLFSWHHMGGRCRHQLCSPEDSNNNRNNFAPFGGIRFGLVDSRKPVPKMGEALGCDVENSLSLSSSIGNLDLNKLSTRRKRQCKSCNLFMKAGACVRMEVDMDSNRRTVQFFVNGRAGRCFVSGFPPSARIGITVFGQGTSFRIDRIARQPRPTPIDPEMGETSCPAFSNNLGYSLKWIAITFTPNWPNSKDDAVSARFLGSWIEQHVSPSAEQEMEQDNETRISRTLIAAHQLHSFCCLSSSSRFLVSDAEQCS
ncbi:hypothetical protein BLNAU_23122 [Blattamonas nauphoetae]|uniref:Uncharacterized protein n=1 Tax=Blattamonas nauphoetae TaxID=2049346 RepID=A0ABQ9WR51_9EUKA|nr:hypothetical protein BLNAU_23122 [Blattamonas nauphoetae]